MSLSCSSVRLLRIAATLLAAGLWAAPPAHALGYAEALDLARREAPALQAGAAQLAGAEAARPAAATLPDPRLAVGVENAPVAGPDRYSVTRDFMTMQRLALMQEVPNRAKREARAQGADARVERERAALAVTALAVRRDAALAWWNVWFAEQRAAFLAGLVKQNELLQQTLPSRVAAGGAMPAELSMARQEALALADRGDELKRDVARARAELRRWVGARADEPLAAVERVDDLLPPVDAAMARDALHRHAELAPYEPMRAMASAEMAEADAEKRGDWSWEVAFQRRPRYDDMVSFQISFDLPWQRATRQGPAVEAKRREVQRIEAEREDAMRRHAAELETMLADLAAVDAQLARLQGSGLALADERVKLQLAAYESGRGDLGALVAARSMALELRLRAIDLQSQQAALRVRLSTLSAE